MVVSRMVVLNHMRWRFLRWSGFSEFCAGWCRRYATQLDSAYHRLVRWLSLAST
jgi:hypothetical protein